MRRGELLANFLMVLSLPVMFAAMIASQVYRAAPTATTYGAIVSAIAGFGLFFKAKISVMRRGQLISYGMKSMDQHNKVFYVCGYALMITALVLMLGIGYGRL